MSTTLTTWTTSRSSPKSQKNQDFVITPLCRAFLVEVKKSHRYMQREIVRLGRERENRDLGYCQNFANERIRAKSQGPVTEQEFHSDDRDLRE